MDQTQYLKQFISSFITAASNVNANALIGGLADAAQDLIDTSVAVTNQLTVSTAGGIYLDKRLAQWGITRPSDLGMSDLAYAEMGIQINALKQVVEILNGVLSTFYGDPCVRASTISSQPEPYALADQDDLIFVLEDGKVQTLTISAASFNNVEQALATEVASVITDFVQSQGYNAYAQVYTDSQTGDNYVQFFGGAQGPVGFVQILGGRIQNQLEFPQVRNTNLPLNTTVWEITCTGGATYRFRWASGPQPLLNLVYPNDRAMIYGVEFASVGISGTFTVTAASPAQPTPTYDAGYFEIEMPNFSGITPSAPNVAPPINNPPTIYSIFVTQNSFDDLKFFLPVVNKPYEQLRYALAFEPADNLLQVFMPATTQVVQRALIGAAHCHLGFNQKAMNGLFGSATNPAQQIIVTSDRCFKVPLNGYDAQGTGGTVSYGSTVVPIDYAFRSQGYLTIVCLQPHGLTGTPDQFGVVYCPTLVTVAIASVPMDDSTEPFLGPYMVDTTANYDLTSQIVTLRQAVQAGQSLISLMVSGQMPNEPGLLLFGLNQEDQEGPVPFLGAQSASTATSTPTQTISQNGTTVTCVTQTPNGLIPQQQVSIAGTVNFNGTWTVLTTPSPTTFTFTRTPSAVVFESTGTVTPVVSNAITTLVMNPAYIFQNSHAVGEDVTLLAKAEAYSPAPNGSDYSFYVTGTANGQAYAQQILQAITAAGINLEIVIVYSSSIGLGNSNYPSNPNVTPHSDAVYCWTTP